MPAHVSFNKAFGSPYKVVQHQYNDNSADIKIYTAKATTGFDIITKDNVHAKHETNVTVTLLRTNE